MFTEYTHISTINIRGLDFFNNSIQYHNIAAYFTVQQVALCLDISDSLHRFLYIINTGNIKHCMDITYTARNRNKGNFSQKLMLVKAPKRSGL